MFSVFPFVLLWIMSGAEDYYYQQHNVTRTTLSGIAAYRSALTLDWLAAEDSRQRDLAAAFETEPFAPTMMLNTDCISYPRPSGGKVGRLMLELLKNLEGDDGTLINELIQTLVRKQMLVETSLLDSEPDFEALVKTPGVMMGEPHATFPRILAMIWLTVTDPVAIRKYGWCPINKVNKYLTISSPSNIARHMRSLEPVMARVRFIMEEFIQNMTPVNMYHKKTTEKVKQKPVTPQEARAVRTLKALPTQDPKPVAEASTNSIFMDPNRLVDLFEDTETNDRTATAQLCSFPSFVLAISWLIVVI